MLKPIGIAKIPRLIFLLEKTLQGGKVVLLLLSTEYTTRHIEG